mmetsp:Transcript_94545/g.229606  ORF Transcript_94545/g.229606 Transcript_94545/m.229606 type:complete len:115 (-) Transcript_94545:284-628(-)
MDSVTLREQTMQETMTRSEILEISDLHPSSSKLLPPQQMMVLVILEISDQPLPPPSSSSSSKLLRMTVSAILEISGRHLSSNSSSKLLCLSRALGADCSGSTWVVRRLRPPPQR